MRILLLCFISLALPWRAYATLDDVQRAVWVNEAIVATYTYDAKNFLAEQKEIATYYSAKGWIAYSKAFNDSKLPEVVKKNAYEVSAVATMPPQLRRLHANGWKAVMPVLVVYKNPQNQHEQKQNLSVSVEFTTAPSDQGVRGYAITSLQAIEASPVCVCCSLKKPTAF